MLGFDKLLACTKLFNYKDNFYEKHNSLTTKSICVHCLFFFPLYIVIMNLDVCFLIEVS